MTQNSTATPKSPHISSTEPIHGGGSNELNAFPNSLVPPKESFSSSCPNTGISSFSIYSIMSRKGIPFFRVLIPFFFSSFFLTRKILIHVQLGIVKLGTKKWMAWEEHEFSLSVLSIVVKTTIVNSGLEVILLGYVQNTGIENENNKFMLFLSHYSVWIT